MSANRGHWEGCVHWLALLATLVVFAVNSLHIHFEAEAGAPWLVNGLPNWAKFRPDWWTLDDAYISMRYAEHWAEGRGVVFNAGERVEGYTTFLWVALLAAGHALGLELPLFAALLGGFFHVATLLLLSQTHRFVPNAGRTVSALAVLIYGTAGIVTGWAMSGMEVSMTAFWVTLALLLHVRSCAHPDRMGWLVFCALACVGAAMSRPDAGIVFLVLFGDRCLASLRNRDLNFFYFGLIFSACYLPYFAWRFWYYGYLLPNTFYAKVSGNFAEQAQRGLDYAMKFLRGAFPVAAVAVTGLLVAGAMRPRHGRVGVLAGLLLAELAYIIAVGGDVMPASRFFAHFFGATALLAALVLGAWELRPLRLMLIGCVLGGWSQMAFYRMSDQFPRIDTGTVGKHGAEVGRWMREHLPPGTLVALNTAGAIPYYSKLPVIDMLGLCDAHIAHRQMPRMGRGAPGHEKGDGKYVLSRNPAYIQLSSTFGARQPRTLPGDHELYKDPEFHRRYEFRSYRLPSGRTLNLYKRRDVADPVPQSESGLESAAESAETAESGEEIVP